MMHVIGLRRVGEFQIWNDQIVWIFLEKEWRFLVRIVTHFDGMFGIVAPDAINAMNREAGILAANRQGDCRGRRENVVHDGLLGERVGQVTFSSIRVPENT